MRRFLIAVFCFTLLIIAFPVQSKVILVTPGGDDANDGANWLVPKRTVTSALSAAISGDEIWVTAGVYPQSIDLKDNVKLYGGFAGYETVRTQRDFKLNHAVLVADRGSTVYAKTGVTQSAVIDGFFIQGGTGDEGGGVSCWSGSPTTACARSSRCT
jgi:hypothetical protein